MRCSVLVLLAVAMASADAFAATPCRDHTKVDNSAASLTKNLQLGGHVYNHVKGE
jgi:hypothetical protein